MRRLPTRRRHVETASHENDERWLLTYADMITLLLAMFMVLFAISSVNVGKFRDLSHSLQDAFSGKVLPGGTALTATGAAADQVEREDPEPPLPNLQAPVGGRVENGRKRQAEEEDFRALKRQIDRYAREHGLERELETHIARRGLVIRLLTDRILFDSGEASLKRESRPLLSQIGRLLKFEVRHPILVEGHTDNVPISSPVFPTNWELSTARAARVVRAFIRAGVGRARLAAVGYGDLRPLASNANDPGRRRNRRVEVVLARLEQQRDKEITPR